MDPVGWLLALSAAAFVAAELLALGAPPLGLTLSARLRRVVGASRWRRIGLVAVLAILYTHIIYAWPW